MKIIKCKDYKDMSKIASTFVIELVKSKPNAILGLSTGGTPVGMYKELIDDHKNHGTSYKQITTINPDEYVGLPKDHDQSYYHFMYDVLFNHIDINEENIHIPSGLGNVEDNCVKYNKMLENYTIDLQILGIGSNGHIGFNEPGTLFDSVTHITNLSESTINDNMRYFENDVEKVPKQAITMGISNIMQARKIILLASGKNKANAISNLVNGKVSNDCPASILQEHKDVTVITDEDATSLISNPKKRFY